MNISFAPRNGSLLGRIAFALVAAVIVVIGFFFFAVALVAGTLLAAVIGLRFWWRMRKLRQQADADVVEGEYSVIDHSEVRTALPPRPDKT